MEDKFLLPGRDGDFDPSLNIWRKGVVFTIRRAPEVTPGYRVSVAFKRIVSSTQALVSFRDLYERVASVGNQRVSELIAANPSSEAVIVCHGWRLLGDAGNIAAAFITLALRSANESGSDFIGEPAPTDEDLLVPGGTRLEDLGRLAPHLEYEFYNEFDFTDPAVPTSDSITVSYAETIPESLADSINFEPLVGRAETFAKSYHSRLKILGEVNSPFRPIRREWFFADPRLATVHICLSQ
jgi:hypothetical protein